MLNKSMKLLMMMNRNQRVILIIQGIIFGLLMLNMRRVIKVKLEKKLLKDFKKGIIKLEKCRILH